MNRETINILRGLAARALRAGLVQLPEIHELSRAIGALDAAEKELIQGTGSPSDSGKE